MTCLPLLQFPFPPSYFPFFNVSPPPPPQTPPPPPPREFFAVHIPNLGKSGLPEDSFPWPIVSTYVSPFAIVFISQISFLPLILFFLDATFQLQARKESVLALSFGFPFSLLFLKLLRVSQFWECSNPPPQITAVTPRRFMF